MAGVSSFDPDAAKYAEQLGYEVRRHTVSVQSLDEIYREHAASRTVDFLKIDAETFEERIIRSCSWRACRPTVICVEAVEPNSAHQSWEPVLLAAEYRFACFDGINNFYVAREQPEILTQFNATVNLNDRYRRAILADYT